MILVDSSVWVEYDRATGSPPHLRLKEPRGMLDCMIAAVAWRRHATLLAYDADLTDVAQVIEIEIDKISE